MTYEEYKNTAKEMFIKYCKDTAWGKKISDEKFNAFFEEVEDVFEGDYTTACINYRSGRWKNIFSWHGFMGHIVGNLIDLYE